MNPFFGGALVLRRRSVWEAVDSGVLLWRDSFVHFIPFFAIPLWTCACCLRLLPGNFHYLSYLILWWLKPLFDRLVLHMVSRRFFDTQAASRFGELRGFLQKASFRGLAGDLLWRRFSPGRSAAMPVRVLERIDREQFRQRKKALAAGGLDFCFLISAVCLAIEAMLLLGEIAFAVLITQMFFPSAFQYLRNNIEVVEIFIFVAYCFNYIIVESLYVCMGFGLYINSRVEVEGWDLQLLFQKFAGSAVKAVLIAGLFLALLFAPLNRAEAEESAEVFEFFPSGFPHVPEESLENLNSILASKDFGAEKEGWGIQLRQPRESQLLPDLDLVPWLEKIRRVFGYILRFFVVLSIAAFLVFALYWLRKYQWNSFRSRAGSPDRRESFGNPLLPAESPESLFGRAELLYGRGNVREAWAACLSGSVGAYSKYRSLSFPAGATEYDCLELLAGALPGEAGGFGELVQNWVLLAYGGRFPPAGAFEKALGYGRSIANNRSRDEP